MAFKAGAVVGEAILETDQWEGGAKRVGSSTKSMAEDVFSGMAAFEAIKAAIGFAVQSMTAAVAAANEYQKSFANITSITNDSTAGYQNLSRQLLNLDSALGSTKELTDAMYQAISSGAKPGAEALQLVIDSAKFARAGLTNTAVAVNAITTATNAYGSATMSSTKAANLFFQNTQYGKYTAEQIASSIGKSIPLYSTLGVKLEELSAGMAAMSLSGISAEESTTKLNAIMNAFLKPSEAMEQLLKRIGYESGDAFIRANGLSGALKMLEDQTNGSASELSKLIINVEGIQGAMALSGEGGKNFAWILEEMEKGANVTDEAFRKQINTFDKWSNATSKTQIIIGNIGKSFIDKILGPLTETTDQFNRFILSTAGIEFFAGIAEKVGYGFSVIKQFAVDFYSFSGPALNQVFEKLREVFSKIFPENDSNPIRAFSALQTAVKILGFAVSVSINIWAGFFKVVLNLFTLGNSVLKVISSVWAMMTGEGKLADVKESLKNVGAEYVNFYKDIGSEVVQFGKNTVESYKKLGGDIKQMSEETKAAAEQDSKVAGDAVRRHMGAATLGVKQGIKDMTKEWRFYAETVVNEAGDATVSFISRVQYAMEISKQAATDATKAVENVLTKFNESLGNAIGDAAVKTLAKVSKTIAAIKPIVSEVINSLQYIVSGIERVMNLAVANITDGLKLALSTNAKILDEELTARIAKVTEAVAAGVITEAEGERQKAELTKKYQDEKDKRAEESAKIDNAIKQKQFEAQKSINVANIWMNAASSIMGFWASSAILGPIAGPIAAGLMTGVVLGIAGAETALVNSQKYVPAYAEGTNSAMGGTALVGEQGPELVNLPRGAQVIPAGPTAKMIEGSRGITINFNGAVVRERQDIDRIVSAIEQRLGRKVAIA